MFYIIYLYTYVYFKLIIKNKAHELLAKALQAHEQSMQRIQEENQAEDVVC